MKLATFNTFKKLMGQTISESDGEALNALRAANRLLERESITWERVLDRSMRVEHDIEAAPAPRPQASVEEQIREAFAVLDNADLKGDFEDFIGSLREQFQNRGSLSLKQRDALFKAADRERNKGSR